MVFLNKKVSLLYSVRVSIFATAVAGMPMVAMAGSFTPPTSGPYRLAFVTSDTTVATSTDISTYNSFVTSEAAFNSALPITSWTAIASTASTDALSNTSCNIAGCASDPIYLVDGTELATTLANFFADNLLSTNAIAVDETGAAYGGGYVWTGSNSDGTGAAGATLGTSYPEFGDPYADNGLSNADLFSSSTDYSLYAISAPIGSSINVPEPASAAILLTGVVALAASGNRRRSIRL
jgi:hypothetical protein